MFVAANGFVKYGESKLAVGRDLPTFKPIRFLTLRFHLSFQEFSLFDFKIIFT